MKQFSLDEYLKNPNHKVVTRDGRNVRIICTDAKLESTPILALAEQGDGDKEALVPYTKDGKFMDDIDANCYLFFATEKHEGWVNVFNNLCISCVGSRIFKSKEDAENVGKICSDYITTVKIEWEE